MKQKITILAFVLVGINSAFGQISYPGKLKLHQYTLNYQPQKVEFVASTPRQFKTTGSNLQFKKSVFAIPVDTLIKPSTHGEWHSLPNGKKIWTCAIAADNAQSINLIFKPFHLNNGVKLVIGDTAGNYIRGSYTIKNNHETGILAVSPIPANYIVVELQLERGVDDFGKLAISRIGLQPKVKDDKAAKDQYFGTSKYCHVDVQCISDSNIQLQKNSVVRLVFNGTDRCTGTLVNNTKQDGKPYIITAGHCIEDEEDAFTSIFYFNYESPYCNGPDAKEYSVSGAKLLARSNRLDFALLELYDRPPMGYTPLYSGWNIRDINPMETYTLHHPEGDVKKVSLNEDLVYTTSFPGFETNSFWLVLDYELGSTEFGSSGSGLFNAQDQLVGTLTVGDTACSDTIYDHYQKFGRSWNDKSESDEQLEHWLNPDNQPITEIGNYDPTKVYRETAMFLSNYDTSLTLVGDNNQVQWGYIAGHNYLNNYVFAEKFNAKGTKYIDAVVLNPQKINAGSPNSSIELIIWEGDKEPEKILHRQNVYLFEMEQNNYQTIQLTNLIKVDYNFFVGYVISYQNELDTFALYFTANSKKNSAYTFNQGRWGAVVKDGIPQNGSISVAAVVYDYIPNLENPDFYKELNNITIYPNPGGNEVQVILKNKNENNFYLNVYNTAGQLMLNYHYINTEKNFPVDVSFLKKGVYIFKFNYNGKIESEKFIKM